MTFDYGQRIVFTNPSTKQQLVGTVVGRNDLRINGRTWKVEFDSWMFPHLSTRYAFVSPKDLQPLVMDAP